MKKELQRRARFGQQQKLKSQQKKTEDQTQR